MIVSDTRIIGKTVSRYPHAVGRRYTSPLAWGATSRIGVALGLIILLWSAVFWALV